MVDLQTLRAFVSVAREGSVSRAAEHLHLTQPAISLKLKQLQQEVGLPLFRRRPQGLTLTEDGEALLPAAEKALATAAAFEQQARALHSTLRGRLRIGTIVDPEFIRLGAFLHRLVERAPQLETELHHGMSGSMLDAPGPRRTRRRLLPGAAGRGARRAGRHHRPPRADPLRLPRDRPGGLGQSPGQGRTGSGWPACRGSSRLPTRCITACWRGCLPPGARAARGGAGRPGGLHARPGARRRGAEPGAGHPGHDRAPGSAAWRLPRGSTCPARCASCGPGARERRSR